MKRILPLVISAVLVASTGSAAFAAKMTAEEKAIAKECHKEHKKDKAGYKKCVADKKGTAANNAAPAAAPAAK